jgi:Fe-S cluster biogenesis protein NfuA
MVTRLEEGEFQQRLQRVETLVQAIQAHADQQTRAVAQELVQTILALHAAGLERIVELIAQPGQLGGATIQQLAEDELVASLLLLHGLHPVDLPTRVARALDWVQPQLSLQGGRVELLGLDDGLVRLRLEVTSQSRGSSTASLEQIVAAALYDAAPDVLGIQFDSSGRTPGWSSTFIPLDEILGEPGHTSDIDPRPALGAVSEHGPGS